MKKCVILSTVLVSFLLLSGVVWAHVDIGRELYAVQFPDELIPKIDGDLSDWDIVPPAYWAESEDFSELYTESLVDQSNLYITMKSGWNESANRLFFSMQVFDDKHRIDREDPWKTWRDDDWEIWIDADHSGPAMNAGETEEEKKRLNCAYCQHWIFAVPELGDTWYYFGNASTWGYPDYWNFGWSYTGEQFGESTYYYEFSTIPFSDLDYHGPEVTKFHDLEEGEIIHVGHTIGDDDADMGPREHFWMIGGAANDCTKLADMILSPVDPEMKVPTAVESRTWGRIKSNFVR